MTSFSERIDIFKHLSTENNAELFSKINFIGLVGSTAMMAYLYQKSAAKPELEEKYGEDFSGRLSNYFRYAAFGCGTLCLYHFLLYPKYPIKDIQDGLGIPDKFDLNDKTRYLIASLIAIPAIIIELFGWKEAKWTPLNPAKFEKEKELFGGIYNYIRHPIYLCEFSWFYTLSLLLNNPSLLILSGVIMQPACYALCKADEMDAINHFGDRYKKYCDKTGFWFPKSL
mmetsp:Transcript_9128/g.8210  ORF Transcript_9128/g.8210 Transcript_9128/m.8210 type:complete len:227 (-) Transcript_9128:199-879(-)